MSWEKEALAESAKEQEQYKLDVMDDFKSQSGFDDVLYRKEFIDFLLFRMWSEGLPAKEPRD